MRKALTRSFFNQDTLHVAEALIGKFLVRQVRGREVASMITEVEAYDGFEDKASHAHRGKTPRNEIMFGEAGRWYVYLCYGMHYMLNIVVGEKEYPAAVLIRAVESVSGPGRVTKAFAISMGQNKKGAEKKTGLWIEDRGVVIPKSEIMRTPRIGLHDAKEWTDVPYRFLYEPTQHQSEKVKKVRKKK